MIDARDVPLGDAATTPLGACVARVLASLTFPEPAKGVVVVVYPLTFDTGTTR